jgi:conjugative relaxase-like TrwC/TraI family protein
MFTAMVRFDDPCVSTKAAVKYFREHMAKKDYLSQGGQQEMTWIGEGAKQLRMAGLVQEKHFSRLCEGKHPITGERLGVRDKGPLRRVCYFGQISPPKDVSIALLVGGDDRIATWWKEAVNETVKEIDAATAARIRKDGIEDQNRYTNKMVAAMVTHDASRALDPQLHTHVCIMNVTYDDVEKQWKSVQPEGYFKHQGYFREICYNKLAERMIDAGYEVERARKIGFHIKGFPVALRDQFSKRHEEIEKVSATTGVTSQDGLQFIARSTRADKVTVEPAELRRQWREASGDHLTVVEDVIASAAGERQTLERITVTMALDLGQAQVFERYSVIGERALLREALVYGRGDVRLDELKREVEVRIKKGHLIRKGDEIVSRETLLMEREYLDWALTYKRRHSDLGKVDDLDRSLKGEYGEAVKKILFCQDKMVILQGKAGSGKTLTLKEVVKGIKKAGNDVFACAPSSGATEILRERLTPEAESLQQLLINHDLQRRIKGRVIIVDEAGLISTRQMRDLCRVASQNDNRLVLVGDIGQHNSVEAGDALRALQTYGKVTTARLTKILRQRDPAFRNAVSLLADKKAYTAFHEFDRLGAVKQVFDPKELLQLAADDYVQTHQKQKSCLVISPVWSDIHRFTDAVRPKLKAIGLLGSNDRVIHTFQSYQWTKADQQHARSYEKGDVLAFHQDSGGFAKGEYVHFVERRNEKIIVRDEKGEYFAFIPTDTPGFDVGLSRPLPVAVGERLLIRANLKEHKLFNGNIVQVASVHEDGTLILSDKRLIPPDFRQFSHGYATTSHAGQGKTVDRGIVLMTSDGIRAANLRQAYVSHSRFEESHVTYTTDKKRAIDAMATPAERKLAIEVVNDRIRRWKIFQKLTEQTEAWSERRKLSIAACQSQPNKINQGVSSHAY